MPTGSLPSEGKKLWESVYDKALKGSCKDAKDPKQCAAGSAWKAVKNAGWKKGSDGKWHKSIQEFSLTIKKAFTDDEGNRRWRADASDTETDLQDDSMTTELFKSFIQRINDNTPPPEDYTSDFWSGGIPYLSVSHYPDLDGNAVPGKVDAVYVDGKFLKAKGTFFDNPLGDACWKSICEDQERIKKGENVEEGKIRVSIAFLDYKHKHKSTGTVFERKDDEICLECLKELLSDEPRSGREFLDGHLIHLAMTRVPANPRTYFDIDEEVDKSMTTRKEDAASIIGEELAEELDKKAKEIGKSLTDGLTIKSDDKSDEKEPEEVVDEIVEEQEPETEPEVVEEEVVEESDPFSELKAEIAALKALVTKPEVQEPEIVEEHILDGAFAEFKSQFDDVYSANVPLEQKLQSLQTPFNTFASVVRSSMEYEPEVEEVEDNPEAVLVRALTQALKPLSDKMDMVLSQRPNTGVPPRRSLSPEIAMKAQTQESGKPLSISAAAKRGMGL